MEEIEKYLKIVDVKYTTNYSLSIYDKDELPSPHTHKFFELFIMLEGTLKYTVGYRSFCLSPLQIAITPPFRKHFIEPVKSNEENPIIRSMTFQFEIDDDKTSLPIFALLKTPQILNLNPLPEVITLIHTIAHHNVFLSNEEFALLKKSYVMQLLVLLYKSIYAQFNINTAIHHLTLHIQAYINQHLTEKITSRTITNHLNYSESYANKIFKNDMQISIMTYIKNRRLDLAKALIFGGEKPVQAMYKCGFNDYSNFFKDFVKTFGITPKQMWTKYRKESPNGKQHY